MPKFCEICNNLVIFDNAGNFICSSCKNVTKMTDEESMISDNHRLDEAQQFTALVRGSPKDPTSKKINIKCEKCNEYKTVIHLGVEEKTLLLCYCIYK
jgi:DNA-directed RNA polymerase subunit M/transcription elongation factor TFIIS